MIAKVAADRVEHPQPAAIRPGQPDADDGQRHQHAEVRQRAEQPQRPRPLGVRFLALGVDHLGGVHEQHRLARFERQPGARIAADEVERPRRPVARHVGRRQRAAGGALGQLGGVEPLELRRAPAEAQRRVAAVGAGVVADVEVGPELRGGEIHVAADRVVAQDDGAEDQGDADRERRHRAGAACRPVRHAAGGPRAEHRDQHQCVLAGEAEARGGHAQRQPQPAAIGPAGQDRGDQRHRGRDERHVQHRFLDQAVEEDGRCPERQQGPGDDPGASGEEPRRRPRHQHRGQRPDHRLDDAHRQQVVAGHGVDDAQEVGIQRRLVEDVGANPVPAGQPHRPLVVAAGVAHQHREVRRRRHLPHVQETQARARRRRSPPPTATAARAPRPEAAGRPGWQQEPGAGRLVGKSVGTRRGVGGRPRKLSIARRPARPRRGDRRPRPSWAGRRGASGPAGCAAARTTGAPRALPGGGRAMGTGEGFPCQDCMKQMPARDLECQGLGPIRPEHGRFGAGDSV